MVYLFVVEATKTGYKGLMPEATNTMRPALWVRFLYKSRSFIAGLSFGLFLIWSFYLTFSQRSMYDAPPPMLIGVLGYDGHLRHLWEQYGSDAPYFGGWQYTVDTSLCLIVIFVSQWIHARSSAIGLKWIPAALFSLPLAMLLTPFLAVGLHHLGYLEGVFYESDIPLVHYGHSIAWHPYPVPIFTGVIAVWGAVTFVAVFLWRERSGWLAAVRRSLCLLIVAGCIYLLTYTASERFNDPILPGLHSMWVLSAAASLWAGFTLTTLLFHPVARHLCTSGEVYDRLPIRWFRQAWRPVPPWMFGRFVSATDLRLFLMSGGITIILFLIGSCFIFVTFSSGLIEYFYFGVSYSRGSSIEGPVIPLVTPIIAWLGLWSGVLAYIKYYRRRWRYWNYKSLYCAGCWYDLRGSVAAYQSTCPECGALIPDQKSRNVLTLLESSPLNSN
jgi:hypothetical protein